jgi:hypothetical protein
LAAHENIYAGNLISNSYFQWKLGEPIFLHVFSLRALFPQNLSLYIKYHSMEPLEITVRNMVLAKIFSLGIIFLTVIPRGT